jgi:stage V sporulation protein S
MADETEVVLRVKSTSSVPSLASAIACAVYDKKPLVVRAIGAGAVNQAVKAIAVARGYVAPRGLDLSIRPGFSYVDMPGEQDPVTAITLKVDVN